MRVKKIDISRSSSIAHRIITQFYSGSLFQLLKAIYPAFGHLLSTSLSLPQQQPQQFFQYLATQLNILSTDQWYEVDKMDVIDRGGESILNNYSDGSLIRALHSIYPTFSWEDWKFSSSISYNENNGNSSNNNRSDYSNPTTIGYNPSNYPTKESEQIWENKRVQVQFMNTIGKQLGIRQLDDWYTTNRSQIEQLGGSKLLRVVGGSLFKLLSTVYPDHDWKEWRFKQVSKGYWNDTNTKEYLDWLSQKLKISSLDDWYNIPANQIHRSLLLKHGGKSIHHFDNSISLSKQSMRSELILYLSLRDSSYKQDIC